MLGKGGFAGACSQKSAKKLQESDSNKVYNMSMLFLYMSIFPQCHSACGVILSRVYCTTINMFYLQLDISEKM